MRISRIYQACALSKGQLLTLDARASHYVSHVLRLHMGDKISVFNGQGIDYTASVQGLKKLAVTVRLEKEKQIDVESPLKIHLYQAISRREKMDFTVQKAVELGVHTITPVITERAQFKLPTDRLLKKREHWQGVIISACEQSGRAIVPTLNETIPFDAINFTQNGCFNIILSPTTSQRFCDVEISTNNVGLVIGSEGGFTESELKKASLENVIPVSLGPRILRTETAGLVALSVVQYMAGDI